MLSRRGAVVVVVVLCELSGRGDCAAAVVAGGGGGRKLGMLRRARRVIVGARAGAEVAGVAVLMELGFLGGRPRLKPALDGAPLKALISL